MVVFVVNIIKKSQTLFVTDIESHFLIYTFVIEKIVQMMYQ